jgi:ribonucleoside-diphosphate reductase beta chain
MTLLPTSHSTFVTTSRGLDRQSPAMRLFEKAKRLGAWNPSDLIFDQDIQDWQRLSEDERDLVLRLTSMFQSGEEAVTLDLLPLIMTIAREGRIEEEMFLTTFLWEEAKHTDFFRRFLDEVAQHSGDLSHFAAPSYRTIVYEVLPEALGRLIEDASPAAQIRASVTYNMIVEGVLAETGYHAYHAMLERNGLMPGQLEGVRLLKQDESRHIAYGIYLISRLIATDDGLWDVAESTLNSLMTPALNVVTEVFDCYEVVPFGLQIDEFASYALMQYQKRYQRLLNARGQTADAVADLTHAVLDDEDA